ncbi:hypothetical protein ACH4PR_53750 [Streptomyces mirabilis]|jgi:hypothetical protein|uniref:hypothetical protein n=1 Tax=Streptomyces mirabilis TaxID=68239 RepID=UPI0037AE8467
MAVAAQVIDARVSRRLGAYLDASRPRAAPRRPSPSLRQDGTLQEVFAEEARQAPDPGAPRRAAAELGDVGQVRSWLTGRDVMDTCVKNHKGVISRRSAFMVVLVPQLIRLEIEATALVMRSTAEQHE